MSNVQRTELIFKTIEKNPGIGFCELMRSLNLKNGVLSHHLSKLEKQAVLRIERAPRVSRFYSLDITESEIPIAKRLRQETPRRILQLLLENEKINFSTISLIIKKSPGTTSFYATQLVQDGIIKDKFEHGKRFFSIVDRETVSNLISKYHPDLIERVTDNYTDIISTL